MFTQADVLLYLEHKKLLSEDGQGVEASIADVGFGVGVGRLGTLWRAMRSSMAVMLPGVWGWVEARRRYCGWGPGWLRCSVWWTYKGIKYLSIEILKYCDFLLANASLCLAQMICFPVICFGSESWLMLLCCRLFSMTTDKWCLQQKNQLTAAAPFVIMTKFLQDLIHL